MAKNDKDQQMNYKAELRQLKERGPERLYFLWGPEDYLREHYFTTLKELCIPDGDDSFSLKRLNGPELELRELRAAVDSPPFMTERSLVELRGVDVNKLPEPDGYVKLLSDIPDYCTVVFIQSAEYEPDGRLKLIKALKTKGRELKFTPQPQSYLKDWIRRRFEAAGKSIDDSVIEKLILISGDRMSALIPEIDKVAAYAGGEQVTAEDVETVADHVPEAVIFQITDLLAQRQFDRASLVLSELLADKKNEPIAMLAMIGMQMRRMYAARLALDRGLGAKYVMESCAIKYDFIANKLISSARGFTLSQLADAVELCADTDYAMKSSSADDTALIKELFMRIAAGESYAQR